MTKSENEKSFAQRALEKTLAVLARMVLLRYQPRIVAVSGSVGKTLTKDAIAHVLEDAFVMRKTEKNYNNEIGVPLTILGISSPGASLAGWWRVGLHWVRIMIWTRYPQILVLEYAIDRPGDMDVLISIARPHVAVLTVFASVHQAFFPDVDAIAAEKSKLAHAVCCDAHATQPCGVVLNADDPRVARSAKECTVATRFYSAVRADADFFASDVSVVVRNERVQGLSFKVNHDGTSVPIRLPHVLAVHHVYAVLAAIAVAQLFKMNLVDIAARLASYMPPPGRMRVLPGKRHVTVLDDTYNASPIATQAALTTLADVPAKRRIAVLGDMLELGVISHESHSDVVRKAMQKKIDILILVGKRFAAVKSDLKKGVYSEGETLFFCQGPQEAGTIAQEVIREGDCILVKGSQGMRMEKVVEQLVHDDCDITASLCRQDPAWKAKPVKQQ